MVTGTGCSIRAFEQGPEGAAGPGEDREVAHSVPPAILEPPRGGDAIEPAGARARARRVAVAPLPRLADLDLDPADAHLHVRCVGGPIEALAGDRREGRRKRGCGSTRATVRGLDACGTRDLFGLRPCGLRPGRVRRGGVGASVAHRRASALSRPVRLRRLPLAGRPPGSGISPGLGRGVSSGGARRQAGPSPADVRRPASRSRSLGRRRPVDLGSRSGSRLGAAVLRQSARSVDGRQSRRSPVHRRRDPAAVGAGAGGRSRRGMTSTPAGDGSASADRSTLGGGPVATGARHDRGPCHRPARVGRCGRGSRSSEAPHRLGSVEEIQVGVSPAVGQREDRGLAPVVRHRERVHLGDEPLRAVDTSRTRNADGLNGTTKPSRTPGSACRGSAAACGSSSAMSAGTRAAIASAGRPHGDGLAAGDLEDAAREDHVRGRHSTPPPRRTRPPPGRARSEAGTGPDTGRPPCVDRRLVRRAAHPDTPERAADRPKARGPAARGTPDTTRRTPSARRTTAGAGGAPAPRGRRP